MALGAVVGTGSATASPHLAAGPEAYALYGTPTVTSSTHHKLVVDIDAAYNTGSPNDTTQFDITLNTPGGAESHQWILAVPNKVFALNSHGGGTLMVPPARIAPYGIVRMTFTPIGAPKTQTCSPTSYVQTQRERLTGRFYFDSASTGKQRWGTVGRKHGVTTFTKSVTLDSGFGQTLTFCEASHQPTSCQSTLYWDVHNKADTVSVGGSTYGKGHAYVEGRRYVPLTKPAGAVRMDVVFSAMPPPTLTLGAGGAATMSLTSKGRWLSGSAKLVGSTTITTTPYPCGNGDADTDTDQEWSATVANGAPPFELNAQIFGKFKLRPSMMADASAIS
jgi:hypothetical protein